LGRTGGGRSRRRNLNFETAKEGICSDGALECGKGWKTAAMEELKQTRLMTLDETQAKAAEALGHKMVRPGRE